MRAALFEIENDWTAPGQASLAGRHAIDDFAATFDLLRGGNVLAVPNIPTARHLGNDAASYAKIGAKALIKVPLLEKSDLVGLLYVHDASSRVWTRAEIMFAQGVADRTYTALAQVRAVADQFVLNQELSHRLKNTLAMVQAIARQTFRSLPDQTPVGAFEKRLQALSTAHDVLLQQSWTAARVSAIVESVLENFGEPDRFHTEGPDFILGARAALALSLLLHELTTNAVKYGALSNETGMVAIDWHIDDIEGEAQVVFRWRETGGPPAQEPTAKGFGSRLIRMGLGGTGGVSVRYLPSGFEADIRATLDLLQEQ